MRAPTIVLLILYALAGCADAPPQEPPAMGTLERDRIELGAEVYEPIAEIAVREGDEVGTGDLIARLDGARLDTRVAHARAVRDTAEANVRLAVRGPRRERIAEGQARVAAAQGALETARSQLGRVEKLVADEVENRSRLDEARARFEEAQGRRDEAGAALEALLEGTTSEELDLARAELAVADATLSQLALDRDRLAIVSPVAGRIDALPFEVGERPPIGATVAVVLAAGPPYARVHVPAPVRERLRSGDGATVLVDGSPRPFAGTLRWISHDASFTPYFALTQHDRSRLSYLAEIDLTEAAARDLPTGVPAEVRFEVRPIGGATGDTP